MNAPFPHPGPGARHVRNAAATPTLPPEAALLLTEEDHAAAAREITSWPGYAPTPVVALPGVARVFFGGDFVTVTKNDLTEWQALRPQVLGVLMEHFVAGRPVVDSQAEAVDEDVAPEDQEIVDQIKELLDTRVRPAVAGDGGDIVFRGYRDGVVRLHMQGACSGCPSSSATLKHGIENMLRHYVPEVVAVEQVEL